MFGRCCGIVSRKTFGHQPMSERFILNVAGCLADVQHVLKKWSHTGAVAAREIALDEPQGHVCPDVRQPRTLEPGGGFREFRDAGINPPTLDQTITMHGS